MSHPRHPLRFDPEALDAVDPESNDLSDRVPSREELAWELVEVLDEVTVDELNELVAKNVPLETLEFFTRYGVEFSKGLPIDDATQKRLPNLMLLGYLLRVLEDRLLVQPESFDA